MQVQEASLSLGGTEMDYVRFGEGAETLVMLPGLRLHGLRENGRALAHMYRALTDGYTVYILDCPRNVRPPCTLQTLAADTARALDALGIGQADVLGISMGGMIAQYLTLERPALVRRLVLAVTLSRPNDTLCRAVRQWTALAERGDYGSLVRDVMARTYSDTFQARFGRLLPLVSQTCRPEELARFSVLAGACLSCDTYERLGEVRCPVLVVGGDQDAVVTGRAAEEMAERLGCELYMYDDAGHCVCEEAAGDFCARVLAFYQS